MSGELDPNERTLALAATMVEVFRERYGCSDAEMDRVLAIALAVNLRAWADDGEAGRIVLEAMGRLSAAVSQVDAVRASKVEH